ncbi:MAG: divalent-cation tolerance protein CutA [Burkholderiaceae bacterium]
MAGNSILMLTNVPDAETARKIAHGLVESRLAACVNCLPQVASVYRWQGAIEEASEIMLLIKTTAEKYAEAEALIEVLHPYELPEIIAFAMDQGLPAYLKWIEQEVQKDEDI